MLFRIFAPANNTTNLSGGASVIDHPVSTSDAVALTYRKLKPTQRKSVNHLVRHPSGISWKDALQWADERTWRGLAAQKMAFLFPNEKQPQTVQVPLEYCFILSHLSPPGGSLLAALMNYDNAVLIAMAAAQNVPVAAQRFELQSSVYIATVENTVPLNQRFTGLEREVLHRVFEDENETDLDNLLQAYPLEIPAHVRYIPDVDGLVQERQKWPNNPVAALLAKGVLIEVDGWSGGETVAVPTELLPQMNALFGIPATPHSADMDAPVPERVVSRCNTFWLDLWRVLIACGSLHVEITGNSSIHRNSIKRLAKLLKLEEAAVDMFAAILSYNDVITQRNKRLVATPAAMDRTVELFEEMWLKYKMWTMQLIEGKLPRPSENRFYLQGRSIEYLWPALLRILKEAPSKWMTIEALTHRLFQDGKTIKEIRRNAYWLTSSSENGFRHELTKQIGVEVPFLCDLGFVDRSEDSRVIRASSWLANVQNQQFDEGDMPWLPTVQAPPRPIAQPNLEVVAPPGTTLSNHMLFGAFADLISVDQAAIYSFSLASVHRGVETHTDIKPLVDALGGPTQLPTAFTTIFEDSQHRFGEISFVPCTYVVQVRQPHLGKILETMAHAVPLNAAAGVYALEMDSWDLKDFLTKLKKKGFFPLLKSLPRAHASERHWKVER